jgi:DNA-binding NtrC family response regulator
MLELLVVDADDGVCEVVATGLEQLWGAAVTRAHSGVAATQALTTRRIDLAIIEPRLPDISGFELAESVADRNVPVLLINGHPSEQISCKSHGYPHLDKPFRLTALADAARQAVQNAAENITIIHQSYAELLRTREEKNRILSDSRQLRSESRRLKAELARELIRSQQLATSVAVKGHQQRGS